VSSTPHHFGNGRLAWFTLPHPADDGTVASCAAVLCPPVGYEAVCADATLDTLADRLAAAGITVATADLPGLGNSDLHPHDATPVEAWIDTVVDTMAELRRLGYGRIVVIAARLGAAIATHAIERVGHQVDVHIDGVALWDPLTRGRQVVRMLQLLGAPMVDGDGTMSAGIVYRSDTLAALQQLTPAAVEVPSLLVVRRPESATAPLTITATTIDDVALEGSEAVFDCSAEEAVRPLAVLDRLTAFATQCLVPDAVSGGGHHPRVPLPVPVTVGRAVVGADVVRRDAVRLGRRGVFAMVHRPEHGQPERAVVMLNNGVAPNVGPGRAWVPWADRLAAGGLTVARLDFGGIGRSPAARGRPLDQPGTSYPDDAVDDIVTVVEHLRSQGVRHVALLGLCSGALIALDAIGVDPAIELAISINARLDKPVHGESFRRRGNFPRTNRLLAVPLSKTRLLPAFERVPSWLWRCAAAVRLVGSPAAPLERTLSHPQARVVLVFGGDEWGLRALRQRDPARWERLQRTEPRLEVHVHDALDHSMFDPQARDVVWDLVSGTLSEWSTQPAPQR
jgi:alpha-beta hydrolase superfamily lysophospholipase